MKAGRTRMETLGNRLETVRKEIEGWERREGEWQARVSRRLRMLWGVVGSVILVLVVAYGVQSWRLSSSSSLSTKELHSRVEMLSRDGAALSSPEDLEFLLASPLRSKSSVPTSQATSTRADPLHLFDEL